MQDLGSQIVLTADQDRTERRRLASRLHALRLAGQRAASLLTPDAPEGFDLLQERRDVAYLAYLAGGQDPRD